MSYVDRAPPIRSLERLPRLLLQNSVSCATPSMEGHHMTHPLQKYLAERTPEERCAFAEKASSSPVSLRLAARGYKTGGTPKISAEFAARIEAASDGELPRDTVSATCAACPLACAARSQA